MSRIIRLLVSVAIVGVLAAALLGHLGQDRPATVARYHRAAELPTSAQQPDPFDAQLEALYQRDLEREKYALQQVAAHDASFIAEPRPGSSDSATVVIVPRRAPYDLANVSRLLPSAFKWLDDGSLIQLLPVVVAPGATLIVDSETVPSLLLASDSNGYATLSAVHATLTFVGSEDKPLTVLSSDQDRSDGRAYVVTRGGEMTFTHTTASQLGFAYIGASSGVAWLAAEGEAAGGGASDSTFANNYFGAFSAGADGLTISRSAFVDNVVYGFDPHTATNNTLVEHSIAARNGRHGFIFSEGCTNNVVRDSEAFLNGGVGFMIDDGTPLHGQGRPSDSNTLLRVSAYDNGDVGIVIEGGSNNAVVDSHVTNNATGIAVRNLPSNTHVTGNTVSASQRVDLQIAVDDLSTVATGNELLTTVSKPSDPEAWLLHRSVRVLWIVILVLPLAARMTARQGRLSAFSQVPLKFLSGIAEFLTTVWTRGVALARRRTQRSEGMQQHSTQVLAKLPRRQIGGDRRKAPLPAVPQPASAGSFVLGRFALLVTTLSWLACVVAAIGGQLLAADPFAIRGVIETFTFVVIITLLAASGTAYIITRQGYLRRTRSHLRTPRAEIDAHFDKRTPSTTVLIPSYREQPEVIRQTMLSAALQELPALRVVLLVDDPPMPTEAEDQQLLADALGLASEIAELLEAPRSRFSAGANRAEALRQKGREPNESALLELATDYEFAVEWLNDTAATWTIRDHTDLFFADHVLRALGRDLALVAKAVRAAAQQGSSMAVERYHQLARRLEWIFTSDLATFERKRYLSLSSAPNKAMNLNSYIGLMGSSYHEQFTSAGTLLVPCAADDPNATIHIPETDYIITLDADSALLPEYGLRLVHLMEQPENAKVGVAQTPYSSFPGAPTRVERLAGATTDVQYIVHQGMAEHDAAFWVGANAVLRTSAVRELRVDDTSDGHTISRFISDRTVIEDTESTLDLTARGWSVMNYPERLAYSASPPDFGSLCIQRQRWANGGLIILGKLRAHWQARRARGEKRNPIEMLLRMNYLGSISWTTIGLVMLLAYPFTGGLLSALVLCMAAPYFVVMAADLKRCGYKYTDVVRIYGFNMVMLPVNAAGVLRSIMQMISGQKGKFARTPKVQQRTVAPARFVLLPYLIVLLSLYVLRNDLLAHRWAHGVFAGANALLTAPAILALLGVRNSIADVWRGFVASLYTKARPANVQPTLDPEADWAVVLYQGSTDKPRVPHRKFTNPIAVDAMAAQLDVA